MRPSVCGDGQKIKNISPHLASPVGEGHDTIGCMIIVCSYQIIKGLSIVIVTVPPLRGRDDYS